MLETVIKLPLGAQILTLGYSVDGDGLKIPDHVNLYEYSMVNSDECTKLLGISIGRGRGGIDLNINMSQYSI